MKNAFKNQILPVLLCMIAGASLAILAPIPPAREQTADLPPCELPPPREDQTQLLHARHDLLRQEFAAVNIEDDGLKNIGKSAQNNDVPLPKEPLLFFGLVHQNGRARALMGENLTTNPLQGYTPGETLPGGETLQKIDQNSIVVVKPGGAVIRLNLYLNKDIGQALAPNP